MKFLNIHDPSSMPHDARVDFVYMPTYLATAFLMKSVLLYPSLMDDMTFLSSDLDFCAADVRSAIAGYMLGCTGRNFDGAGVFGLDECVKIFEDADAAEFLERYPNLCPDFGDLFRSASAAVKVK